VHSYNAAPVTAAKLIRAKELALETDAEYYADLWVNCFEACPNWAPPPDVAASDSYLGNGYFPTWCADVARRLLTKAAADGRYAFGESLLTFWPWPNSNFGGQNDAIRVIAVDENGDGQPDREETVAMPILNFWACCREWATATGRCPNRRSAAKRSRVSRPRLTTPCGCCSTLTTRRTPNLARRRPSTSAWT